jgi:phage baseplate assembly protein W
MAIQNPAYKYINPSKDSPAGDKITLSKAAKEFKDVSLAFTPHPITKDLTILRNERAINHSLKNLMMIMFGEVPFDNEIGSSIRSYLFEVMDSATAHMMEDEIKRVIEEYEPRVIVEGEANPHPNTKGTTYTQNSVDNYDNSQKFAGYATFNSVTKKNAGELGVWVDANPEENSFEVTIIYKIVGYEQIFEVNTILYPTRV